MPWAPLADLTVLRGVRHSLINHETIITVNSTLHTVDGLGIRDYRTQMISGIQAAKSLGPRGPFILAAACAVSRQTIYNWDKIPAEQLIAVERATGIDRARLRPDLKALWSKRTRKPRNGSAVPTEGG